MKLFLQLKHIENFLQHLRLQLLEHARLFGHGGKLPFGILPDELDRDTILSWSTI